LRGWDLNPRPSGYEPNDIEAPKSLFHHPLGSKGHTNLYIYFNDIRVRGFILTGAPNNAMKYNMFRLSSKCTLFRSPGRVATVSPPGLTIGVAGVSQTDCRSLSAALASSSEQNHRLPGTAILTRAESTWPRKKPL
jgi:hypothetical protein